MTDHRACCPIVAAALAAFEAGSPDTAEELIEKARIHGTPNEQALARRYNTIIAISKAIGILQH